MGKKLIITEKPSVARDFARVLNVSGKGNGYIENDSYVISWCFGHLVEMVYPEVYDETYKTWRLEDLPFLPEVYKYGVIQNSKDQYELVNKLLHRDDIDVVYWAGDSGKEGQTIEENIRNYGGVREGMEELRVWIDSQTDDEIMRGIKEARPMSEYALLGKSGIMRTIEDYSLGINFSRALSVKYGRMINGAAATSSYTAIAIGRVMTCVLGMVVDREREIRNFVETPFYRITGSFAEAGFTGEWKAVEGSKYFDSPLLYKENGFKKRESAEQLINELSGKNALVSNIESGVSRKKAPLLFNLAELQSECSKLFKISPSQTLDIAQELYEKKLTTYPRTDARVLTTAVAKEISKNIGGLRNVPDISSFAKEIIDNKKFLGIDKTSYTDDKKVTDHYAIIPTGITNSIAGLSDLSKAVYMLIARRFLSIFYPPAEYKTIKIAVSVDKESFFTSAKALMNPGYMVVSGIPTAKENEDNSEGENTCSKEELLNLSEHLKQGDEIPVKGYEIKEGKTSPPKRYTSGNLILAMENAGNLIEDEELREQIKKSGIGTSATRGEILEKLVRIKYLNQNNKTQIISPENLGEMIYEVVKLSVPSLLNPEMTANWEMGLEGIINGTVDDVEYRKKLEDFIRRETTKMINYDLTNQIAANIHQFTGKDSKGVAVRKPLGIACPQCGGELTTTSFGYGCSNYWNEEKKCSFNVGRIAGLDLGEEDFRQLIETGKTQVLSGFMTKNKKPFKAALTMKQDDAGRYVVNFDFDSVPTEYVEGLICPQCGGRMVETGFGFSCENRNNPEKNCNFSVGEIAGRKLKLEEVTALINEGKTDILTGFKSKTKQSFKARLVLTDDESGRKSINFDFSDIEAEFVPDVVCPDCGKRIMIKQQNFGCEGFNANDPDSCKFFIGKIAGKNLSVANVSELIKEGKTSTIRGFKSKTGKRFDAVLVMRKNEAGKSEIAFDFENVEAKKIKDTKCPVCGGEIVKTPFGYGCGNYNKDDPDNSCKFNIGAISGVKLNESQIKELINNGVTPLIHGFKSKSGNSFDAHVALSKDEEGKITGFKFVFPPDEEIKDTVCPKCGQPVIKIRNGCRCKNYSKEEGGCNFYVGSVAGVSLETEQIKKLLTTGKTDIITGFLSKKGLFFDAALMLNEEKNVVFDFSQNN